MGLPDSAQTSRAIPKRSGSARAPPTTVAPRSSMRFALRAQGLRRLYFISTARVPAKSRAVTAEVRDKQNVPEAAASPTNERCQVRAPDVRRGEDYGVHAASASEVLDLGHGLFVGEALERLPRGRPAPVDEGLGGVSQHPFLFQELDRSGAHVLVSYDDHGPAPNTEPPQPPLRQTLHQGR